jgi:hypothetical protein
VQPGVTWGLAAVRHPDVAPLCQPSPRKTVKRPLIWPGKRIVTKISQFSYDHRCDRASAPDKEDRVPAALVP